MRGSATNSESHRLRAPCLRGAKPSKQKRSTGSPETASAVVTADGPGRHVIGMPCLTHAATKRYPGSLIEGIPASVTTSTSYPASRSASSGSMRLASF
ncbi:Uncharacterised protein [Mycobacteroides abscessus subsp. abscessus]|nr:Uncharacterised protein [Mycobacteroides abscessus subsp. abscessus]